MTRRISTHRGQPKIRSPHNKVLVRAEVLVNTKPDVVITNYPDNPHNLNNAEFISGQRPGPLGQSRFPLHIERPGPRMSDRGTIHPASIQPNPISIPHKVSAPVELCSELVKKLDDIEPQLLGRAVNSPFLRLLELPDYFGLLEHTNPSEVINRRIVNEAEDAVALLASGTRKLRKIYRETVTSGGSVDLGTASLGDAYTFGLSARFDEGDVAITVSREDRFGNEDAGFTILRKDDDSIIVTGRELSGVQPVSVDNHNEMFQVAGQWIDCFLQAKAITDL